MIYMDGRPSTTRRSAGILKESRSHHRVPSTQESDKPPRNVTVSPSQLVLNEYEKLNLTCNAAANPDGNYSWSMNGKILEGKTNRVLTTDNITAQDAGEYICTVTHTFGADTSNRVVIYVRYIGNAVCSAPASANEGDVMVLNCSAKGYPPVSYTWTTPDKLHQGPIASIPATADLNGVTVTCKATNKVEISTCTRSLTVYFAPFTFSATFRLTYREYQQEFNDKNSPSFNKLKDEIEKEKPLGLHYEARLGGRDTLLEEIRGGKRFFEDNVPDTNLALNCRR
ncbi:Hemicentin-1 [Exaiptasia diaphana]|nr:Hemicentin-1 [Exaiptasia diaphana]